MPMQAPILPSFLQKGMDYLQKLMANPNIQATLDAADQVAKGTPIPHDDLLTGGLKSMVLLPSTIKKFEKAYKANRTLMKQKYGDFNSPDPFFLDKRGQDALAWMATRYPSYTNRALSKIKSMMGGRTGGDTAYGIEDKNLIIDTRDEKPFRRLIDNFAHELQHVNQFEVPNYRFSSKKEAPEYPIDNAKHLVGEMTQAWDQGDIPRYDVFHSLYKSLPWEKDAYRAGEVAQQAYKKYTKLRPTLLQQAIDYLSTK